MNMRVRAWTHGEVFGRVLSAVSSLGHIFRTFTGDSYPVPGSQNQRQSKADGRRSACQCHKLRSSQAQSQQWYEQNAIHCRGLWLRKEIQCSTSLYGIWDMVVVA